MKTTVEIADPILEEAKRIAAREGVPLRALIEEGLRRTLEERQQAGQFRLRRVTVRGRGLQPEVREGDWARLRELAYEGRGG